MRFAQDLELLTEQELAFIEAVMPEIAMMMLEADSSEFD